MSPKWDSIYVASIRQRLSAIRDGLGDRLDGVVRGRVAPALDDIPIGSGRSVRAAVMFFDIRGFTAMTRSEDEQGLKRTLMMLDIVIPMVMHIVHDVGGYVEKNTGDGVMGVVGVEQSDAEAANAALDAAAITFYVLDTILNPVLVTEHIEPVHARIGIDLGNILIARIGVASGSAKHDRNFLTAVGPTANIASKLQGMAGTDEIWVGNDIAANAAEWRRTFFVNATPAEWQWQYAGPPRRRYEVWKYTGRRKHIPDGLEALQGLLNS